MKFVRKVKNLIKVVLEKRQPTINVYPSIVNLTPHELLKGRTLLITGGTSGIGYSIAIKAMESGAKVIITSRSQNRLDATIQRIHEETGNTSYIYGITLDIGNVSSFQILFTQIEAKYGLQVDTLVNNAGISIASNDDMYADFDGVIQTNLKGTYFLSIAFAEYLISKNKKGHILNIASSSSLRPAITPYMLSKWGVRGLTEGLAKKYIKHGIVVNGIAPGPTATPMLSQFKGYTNPQNPIQRLILPEEIASMAVIMVSDMCNSVVGDILYMTGGVGVITYDDINY